MYFQNCIKKGEEESISKVSVNYKNAPQIKTNKETT